MLHISSNFYQQGLMLKDENQQPLIFHVKVKVKVSHSLIAVGAVGVRVPLYLGHS